jgi:uncharacterized cupin superfamily protein
MSASPIVNIDDVPLMERGHGEKFAVRWGRVGPLVGSTGVGCAIHVVPPGKRAFPFHRHHVVDEMFFILSGTGEYRIGNRTLPLRAGDFVGAPAGGEPHQIINSGLEELRYLAFSTVGSVDLVDYPDSGKIAVAAGIKNADFKTATYAKVGRLQGADYYDGE